MAYIPGVDRTQAVLLPEVLDDSVRPDNPVRFLDAFVAQLDLAALGCPRAVPADTGRPGSDPGDLLRLYLYGYLHRIRSRRHPYGTMKRGMNQGDFPRRGLAKVRGEFRLKVIAYNITRALNRLGVPRRLAAVA